MEQHRPGPARLTQRPPAVTEPADSIFENGWALPWRAGSPQMASAAVRWQDVQQLLAMARDALAAKQRVADALLSQLDARSRSGDGSSDASAAAAAAAADEQLLLRAQRAEVDSGSLLEELEALMQAKAHVAQQRADLDRANALLMAERELLCEQLDVDPRNVNLCQEVQRVLAAARRGRTLEGQVRLLARVQRDLLLQLDAGRENAARAARHWQACEQAYLGCLAAHGIAPPELPSQQQLARTSSSGGGPEASGVNGITASSSSSSFAPLLQRLGSAGAAAASGVPASVEALVGSPSCSHQLLPPTPPASDLNTCCANSSSSCCSGGSGFGGGVLAPLCMRRSHSLDSGLSSITGLLDQLALGQLNSDEFEGDAALECEADGWAWLGPQDEPAAAGAAAGGSAAGAAAALLMLGGSTSSQQQQQQQQQEQQQNQVAQQRKGHGHLQLQPVLE